MLSVTQVRVLSTSPKSVNVNVLSLKVALSSLPIERCALMVNLNISVTDGWYPTLPAISPVEVSSANPSGKTLGLPSSFVPSNS